MDNPIGIWKNSLLNRRPVFSEPAELAQAAADYFAWASNTPIVEEKMTHYKGVTLLLSDEKVRPFSWRALRLFLGVSSSALNYYRKKEEYEDLFEAIDDVIFTQKFEHAAAGMLNPSLIQRDLGLADKQVVEGGAMPLHHMITPTMDPKTALAEYESTLNPDEG